MTAVMVFVVESRTSVDIMFPYDKNHVNRLAIAVVDAGYVTKTFLIPALKLTRLPALLEDSTTSRDSVVPDEVYVPTPTSQLEPD
jgi:hypothetical protein